MFLQALYCTISINRSLIDSGKCEILCQMFYGNLCHFFFTFINFEVFSEFSQTSNILASCFWLWWVHIFQKTGFYFVLSLSGLHCHLETLEAKWKHTLEMMPVHQRETHLLTHYHCGAIDDLICHRTIISGGGSCRGKQDRSFWRLEPRFEDKSPESQTCASPIVTTNPKIASPQDYKNYIVLHSSADLLGWQLPP